MKHLRLFLEHFHKERTENSYYKFIPPRESVKNRGTFLNWDDNEVNVLRSLLPDSIYCRELGRMTSMPSVEEKSSLRLQASYVIVRLKKYILTIYKLEDDWFVALIDGQYGTMMSSKVSGWVYDCDQLEGVVKLIEDIK